MRNRMENGSRSRAAYVIAASAFAGYGLLRKDIVGLITAIAGGGLAVLALAPERTRSSASAKPVVIQRTLTVARHPMDAYAMWRQLENFPRFFSRFSGVSDLGGNRHAWNVRGRLGVPVRWETEIVNDQPGHLIEWRSVKESPIQSSASIRFKRKKGERGTKIHIHMTYVPASGFSGELFNAVVADKTIAPGTADDLRKSA